MNSATGPRDCTECELFLDDPVRLEAELPGLTILSSASGSTRGRCGICRIHNTFQDPQPACEDFRARRSSFAGVVADVTSA